MTPVHVHECGRGLRDVNQSPLVSGTSRSERPCDKHALFERIGMSKARTYEVRKVENVNATILNPDFGGPCPCNHLLPIPD